MSYSVTEIKNDLNGVLHGTTINQITNLEGLFNRTARQLLLDCNPIETKRIAQLGQVFNSVYDYALPTDLKGVQVIDIRPQAGRWQNDIYEQSFARWFDSHKRNGWNNAFNIQHDTGIKTLRLEAPTLPAPVTITDTGNTAGWSFFGTFSNLSLDTTFNIAGGGALQFDISGAGGSLQNTTLSPVDLSLHENISTLFNWVYMPTAWSGVTLSWGNVTPGNYWVKTSSTQQDGTAFKPGWNLVAFPWSSASSFGSPDASQIVYTAISDSGATSAMTGAKICNLTSALPQYMEMVYYSKYLFANSAGAWMEKITDTTSADLLSTVNLDTESYELFFNLLCYNISQQLMGADAQKDGQFFLEKYQKGIKRYTAMYKSETLLPSEPWYVLPRGDRGINVGPRWFGS